MNVLIVGGAGSLVNQLIERLNKEGERVFLLTGSRVKNEKYAHVFEQYNFPYSTEQITEIFESTRPDVTIFTGAFDSVYSKNKYEKRISARYLSDLVSLLTGFATLQRGRFIYLSSDAVFHEGNGSSIPESQKPEASADWSLTLSEAEDICLDYRKNRGLDIVTLRIGGMYHMPENSADVTEPVSHMCLYALSEEAGLQGYLPEGRFAPLNERDAIQFILQVVFAENCSYELYHISADRVLTAQELWQIVDHLMKAAKEQHHEASQKKTAAEDVLLPNTKKLLKEEQTASSPPTDRDPYPILDNTRFKTEFFINHFSDLEVDILKICNEMLDHPEVFLEDKARKKTVAERLKAEGKLIWKALVPVIENLILFGVVLLLSIYASDSRYFSRVDFYLLYVLLFAAVHGQQQAILSAILSVCGYLFGQFTGRNGLDVLVDTSTYIWIAQLFTVGLSVGYLRDRITALTSEEEEEQVYLSGQVADMQEINDSNVRVKDALETQIISQDDSVGKVYQIVAELDRYSGDEVLYYAAEVVEKLMHTKDVAIYTGSSGPYARLFTATTKRARSMGNSIRFRDLGSMYEVLREHRVFINRQLDQNMPMMACAIYVEKKDGEDEIGTVVMVWGLSWERTTLSEANRLAVICALIQRSAARAERYLKAIAERRFIRDTSVMKTGAFTRLLHAQAGVMEKGLTQSCLVKILTPSGNLPQLSRRLRETVRDTDYIGLRENGDLCVLLTNTDKEGAERAIERIQDRGIEAVLTDLVEDSSGFETATDQQHGIAGGIVAGRSV